MVGVLGDEMTFHHTISQAYLTPGDTVNTRVFRRMMMMLLMVMTARSTSMMMAPGMGLAWHVCR